MLSDTVGFIRELPTQLVAAFRATLEETVHADLDLPDSLIAALAGIETAILTTSADFDQAAQHSRFLSAAREAGVKRIIRVSVVAADLASPHFLLRTNAETEHEFSQSGIEATHLRPHSFMQNFLGQVATMRATGKLFSNTGAGRPGMSAVQMTIVSSSTSDAPAGTGAAAIQVNGYQHNGIRLLTFHNHH